MQFTFTDGRSFSQRAIRALRQAEIAADRDGEQLINPAHLLLGLIEEGQALVENQPNNAVRVLENLGVNGQDLRVQIKQTLAEKS